jgi:hypothetical protein
LSCMPNWWLYLSCMPNNMVLLLYVNVVASVGTVSMWWNSLCDNVILHCINNILHILVPWPSYTSWTK